MSDTIEFKISVKADEHGYVERRCPLDACRTTFKVFTEDWTTKFVAEVTCPLCGHRADNHQERWATEPQVEAINRIIREQGVAIARSMLNDAFRKMARRHQSKYLRIEVPPDRPRPPIPEIPASEALRRKVTCQSCGVRYAVVGSAFFCPCCGHNSATETFAEAVAKLEKGFEIVDVVRRAMASTDPDAAEIHARRIFETTVSDGVVALQRLPQALFETFSGMPAANGNVFQRLDDASDLWERATGSRYETFLSTAEWADLRTFFQQRHLLQHSDGFVDQKYIERSGDSRYAVGQRLVVSEAEARRMLTLTKVLGAALQSSAARNPKA